MATPQDKIEIFKEVSEANLKMFVNQFNKEIFEYSIFEKHKITEVLNEDEVRQLAINLFTTMLSKKVYENTLFYQDKKLIVKI